MARSLGLSCAVALFGATLALACGGPETATGRGDGGEAGQPGECAPVEPNAGGGFIPPPEGAKACAAGVCNYQTQAGCALDLACRPQFPAAASSVIPGCEPAGAAQSGEACESSADCARGFLCLPGEGVCRKLCCGGDWSACPSNESCIRQFLVALEDHTEHAVDLCYPVNTCDVFDPTSCDGESTAASPRECKIVDPKGSVACAPASPQQLGQPCVPPGLCAQGLTCLGGTCRRLCRAEQCGEPSCPTEEGPCVHFDRDPPGVGECTPGWHLLASSP